MLRIPVEADVAAFHQKYTQGLTDRSSAGVIQLLDLSYKHLSARKAEIIAAHGIGEYEDIIKIALWSSKDELTFEDFHTLESITINFRLYFLPNFVGEAYRKSPQYQWLKDTDPDLLYRIDEYQMLFGRNGIENYGDYPEFYELLYQAYVIMLSCESVRSNGDLFT